MPERITKKHLAEYVARRMMNEIIDYGGLEDWMERLQDHPEKYLLDLAAGCVDCLDLSGALLHDSNVTPKKKAAQ